MVRRQLDERQWSKVEAVLISQARVEQRGGLGRRASRREIVPTLVGFRELACALGEVQQDRCRCARELVGQVAPPPWKRLDDPVREDEEVQCDVVDVKSYVVEQHPRLVGPKRRLVACFRARVRARSGTDDSSNRNR